MRLTKPIPATPRMRYSSPGPPGGGLIAQPPLCTMGLAVVVALAVGVSVLDTVNVALGVGDAMLVDGVGVSEGGLVTVAVACCVTVTVGFGDRVGVGPVMIS